MTTTTNDSIRGSSPGTLTALRALAGEPSASIADALAATEAQAQHLQALLPMGVDRLMAGITDLMPTILIEYIDDLPVTGISFWGNGHWHIHLRAGAPPSVQQFAVVHELKHIIDHPLRRQSTSFSTADWEALANHFARQLLVIESVRVVKPGERRSDL